jgi:hypothetical protein
MQTEEFILFMAVEGDIRGYFIGLFGPGIYPIPLN